jgi:hypothetical protein
MDLHQLTREDYLALPDDERPHLYPERVPSNSTYVGTKNQPGCRCIECRAEHTRATRKIRQVIQLEAESVTDRPIASEPPAEDDLCGVSGHQKDQQQPQQQAEAEDTAPSSAPPAQAVYEIAGPLTAEEVAVRVQKLAEQVAENTGALPSWMMSAPEIASRFGVPVNVAQAATRINTPYIAINCWLNGGQGAVALIKKPVRT